MATADMSDILSITVSSPKLKRYRGQWTLRKRGSFQSFSHSTVQRTECWQGHEITMPFHVFKFLTRRSTCSSQVENYSHTGKVESAIDPASSEFYKGGEYDLGQRQDVPRSEKYTGENSIRYLQLPPLTIFLFSGSWTRQF